MIFEERLARYKKETDYFVVDIFKGADYPYETKHDLTWSEAQAIKRRAMKNEHISRIDIIVEDWDAEDDFLFKEVDSVIKEPFQWRIDLVDFSKTPIAWK